MTTQSWTVTPVSHESAVAQILGAFQAANAAARLAQRDKTVEGILKQLGQGNFRGIAHQVAVGFNLIDRGAPLEKVEEPGHRYVALVRSRYAALFTPIEAAAAPTLGSLMLDERLAHATREEKLALFLDSRSYYHATQLLDAAARYERANGQLVGFIRQKAVETDGPRLAVARAD